MAQTTFQVGESVNSLAQRLGVTTAELYSSNPSNAFNSPGGVINYNAPPPASPVRIGSTGVSRSQAIVYSNATTTPLIIGIDSQRQDGTTGFIRNFGVYYDLKSTSTSYIAYD